MANVVGIKFQKSPKVYYFDAGDKTYTEGGGVIVETAKGIEYGIVASLPSEVENDKIVAPLKPVMRLATASDEEKIAKFASMRDGAMQTCQEHIDKSGLSMKLVDVEFTFDESKLIVHFTADGRVDFRELVRKLASAFKLRIELRQIGARDECRIKGGIAPCGRVCCCNDHLSEFTHVTVKMAKNQNLSLNPTKISGLCGRLMCCLEYENSHYAETNKLMPKIGSNVKTTDGRVGTVVSVNQLKYTLRLKIADKETFAYNDVHLNDLENKNAQPIEDNDSDEIDSELASLID